MNELFSPLKYVNFPRLFPYLFMVKHGDFGESPEPSWQKSRRSRWWRRSCPWDLCALFWILAGKIGWKQLENYGDGSSYLWKLPYEWGYKHRWTRSNQLWLWVPFGPHGFDSYPYREIEMEKKMSSGSVDDCRGWYSDTLLGMITIHRYPWFGNSRM